VKEYNPERAPEPESWLELDEQERILLVEKYHRLERIKLPNLTMHALVHTIVENQIASNLEPVVGAVGSVVAEHLFELLKSKPDDDAATTQSRYNAAVERLNATTWRGGQR
jgi:hypothetical protein